MQDAFRRQAQFLRTTKPLARDEERDLIATAQSAENRADRDAAAQRIVLAHMPLATKLSWQAAKGNPDSFEDYLNVAVIGMYRAIGGFDLSYPVRFSTYSQNWISEGIKNYRHDELHILDIPGGQRPQKIMRHMLELQKKPEFAGDKPDYEKMTQIIAARTGYDIDNIKNYLEALAPSVSMDAPVPGIEDATIGQNIPSKELRADEILEQDGERAHYRAMIGRALDRAGLSDREKQVVLGRRMVEDGDDVPTLEDFSVRFSVSRERVRQIEVKGMDKLRDAFRKMGVGSLAELAGMTLPAALPAAIEADTTAPVPALAEQVAAKLAAERAPKVSRRVAAPV